MVFIRLRRASVLLFASICIAVLCACSSPKSTAEMDEITDVYVHDVSVYFDNDYHGIDIEGLHDGDVVLYSIAENGVFSSTELLYKDVGVYVIYVKISRDNCHDLVRYATLTISVRPLDGISSADSVAEYDGLSHNISLDGVHDGDSVSYSLDGETFFPSLELVEIGTYTVFYIVTRGYAEYRGSCNITILPSATGTYFNSTHGVIRIDGFSDSDGRAVTYDLSGVGYIGDKPFSLAAGSVTVDGVVYERIQDDTAVHTLSVNGSVVLYFKETSVSVDVSFGDTGADISVNTSNISQPGYNYCESINSVVNDGLACGMSLTVSAENISIILSKRSPQSIENPFLQCFYDGLPHALPGEGLLYEVDGTFVASPPVYTEVGTHSARVVSIKPGYLPEYGISTLVIIPSPDGVYYSAAGKTVIRIENRTAVKNGNSVPLEYTDSGWIVDGVALTEYSALSSGTLAVVSCGDEIVEIVPLMNGCAFISVNGASAAFLDDDFEPLYTFSIPNGVTEVYYNGKVPSSISLPDKGKAYGIGDSDIQAAKGIFEIELR